MSLLQAKKYTRGTGLGPSLRQDYPPTETHLDQLAHHGTVHPGFDLGRARRPHVDLRHRNIALRQAGSSPGSSFRALNRPLAILGLERRGFLLATTLGLAMSNAMNSLVTGRLAFVVGYVPDGWTDGTIQT